jgi:hypothetical protein
MFRFGQVEAPPVKWETSGGGAGLREMTEIEKDWEVIT